ncbi:putative ATP-dependent RNA helicase DHR1 [Dimargaris cristalligena]|nr:putative ATP-dependent RNA helicase DHR1 [Dimargaris cristalligena]
MSNPRPRYNDKARQSSKTKRHARPKPSADPDAQTAEGHEVEVEVDSNALIMPATRRQRIKKIAVEAGVQLIEAPQISVKKQKRLEKYIEKKLEKDERIELFQKLSTSSYSSELMRSSRHMGSGRDTLKERLRRAMLEEREGLPQSDPTVPLYVSRNEVPGEVSDADTPIEAADPTPLPTVPTVLAPAFGGALKRGADGESAVPITKRQRKPKKEATYLRLIKHARNKNEYLQSKLQDRMAASSSESDFDSSDSAYDSSEDESPEPPKVESIVTDKPAASIEPALPPTEPKPTPKPKPELSAPRPANPQAPPQLYSKVTFGVNQPEVSAISKADRKKAFFILVDRPAHIQENRMKLPICAEEQMIMEKIKIHPVVVLCGETGSGKTTQVPQFLYEAGYGHPDSGDPGMIGITQPRRVAAVSMARRVAEELDLTGTSKVAHQIRYDTTADPETAIKFMTDGVLLRELSQDLLLSRYSALIIDEAHERSLNTDILIGVVSRVVKLREKLYHENPSGAVRPLKIIIMSATLRVEDFTLNRRLFPVPPPVIRVDARQFPVKMHFNRRTHADYVGEAYKKVCKIHARLPHGGILVFLTSQNEITALCQKLKSKFPVGGRPSAPTSTPRNRARPTATRSLEPAERELATLNQSDLKPEEIDLGVESEVELDDVSSGSEDGNWDDEESDQDDNFDGFWDGDEEDTRAREQPDFAAGPLHVLPLYSLLPTAQQMRVFDAVPAGHRLCVVATNVAETSLTIPGIRYVIDGGKVKERKFNPQNNAQSFEIHWVSKASADQRAGRAGRTGPGHCYRLYSSAVFHNEFVQFSEPEITQMSIEGVVLQMKGMLLENVVNFPFPTPPDARALRDAENLLIHLGALDPTSRRITEVGKLMAAFPVSPRFSRMLIVGQQHQCLPYVVTIVAALSVGDPVIPEAHVADSVRDADGEEATVGVVPEDDDDDEIDVDQAEIQHLTNADFARKARRKLLHKKYLQAQAQLAGREPTSDLVKLLNTVCAYEFGGADEAFCTRFFLRPKAMLEIRKLRGQLTRLVQLHCPQLDLYVDARLTPPTERQLKVIRQTITAGFIDQVAVRWDLVHNQPPPGLPTNHTNYAANRPGKTCRYTAYVSMTSAEPVFVHPTSVLYHESPPETLAYQELQRTASRVNNPNVALDPEITDADREQLAAEGRLWMKGNTTVHPRWLAVLGKSLTTYSKPLMHPVPRYYYSHELDGLTPEQRTRLYEGQADFGLDSSLSGTKDIMIAHVSPVFGPKNWALPKIKVQHRRHGTRWLFDKIIG